jgi:sodium-dependent dicarboxylate transporter 2/3/5
MIFFNTFIRKNIKKAILLMVSNELNSFILGFILVQGFFVSRLFIFTGITDSLNYFFLKKSKGDIKKLFFYLMILMACVSLFVSNVICMLTFLPLLHQLKKDIEQNALSKKDSGRCTLVLIFLGMFSVNLGGLGVLTASPIHLLVIWFALYYKIPDAQNINFFTWLLWGIPIVLILGVIIYFVCLSFVPKNLRKHKFSFDLEAHHKENPKKAFGITLTLLSLVIWLVSSILSNFLPRFNLFIVLFLGFYTLLFFLFLFIIPFSFKKAPKRPLIPFRGLFSGIPSKGVAIIIFTVILSYLFSFFKIDSYIEHHFSATTTFFNQHLFLLILLFGIIAIFSSEILSNTGVCVLLFNLAIPFSGSGGGIALLVAISLLSTIPSMTPMASPVNALVLGSIQGVFNKRLILLGFITNIICTIIISLFCAFVLPPLFALLFH